MSSTQTTYDETAGDKDRNVTSKLEDNSEEADESSDQVDAEFEEGVERAHERETRQKALVGSTAS